MNADVVVAGYGPAGACAAIAARAAAALTGQTLCTDGGLILR